MPEVPELNKSRREFDRQLSKNVRNARKAAGLSQKEFARRCGVTAPHACEWETGRIRISAGRLAIIARALGVPPMTLWPQYDTAAD